MNDICDLITLRLYNANKLKEHEISLFRYSIELFFSGILISGIILVISFASNTFIECIGFMIGFIPMRSFAGGYHGKNHAECIIISTITYLITIIILKYCNVLPREIMLLLSCLIVIIIAPVEANNKRLTKKEKLKLRVMTICFLLTILVITYLTNTTFVNAIIIGIFSATTSMVIRFVEIKGKQFKALSMKK